MANNYINANGSFQFFISNQLTPASMVLNNITITGNNYVSIAANVLTGSGNGTPALTASLSNIRYTFMANESPNASTLFIYSSNNPSTTPICIMQQGDFAVLPQTASVNVPQYWAFASGSTNDAIWQYVMCEN